MKYTAWILNRIAPDIDESLIDRDNLTGEIVGGQYENIKILDALRRYNIDAHLIDLRKLSIDDILEVPDISFVRMTSYLDIPKIQKIENMGSLMLNPVSCHVKCSIKWTHLELLKNAGIKIPDTILIEFSPSLGKKWDWNNGTMYEANLTDDEKYIDLDNNKQIQLAGEKLGWPLIVKPLWGTGGELVQLCHNINDFIVASKKIQRRYNTPNVLAQKYINHNIKGVISAWMLGNEIKFCQLRKANSDTQLFISNNAKDGIRQEYKITTELADICARTSQVLSCEISKIDLLCDENGYMICEVNAPGAFTGVDSVSNVDYGAMIAQYGIERLKAIR